jgi:uncharacterized membrane protein
MRPLTEAERKHLALRIRVLRNRVLPLLIVPLVSLALGVLMLTTVPEPMNLVVGCFGMGLLVPAASVLAARDAWRRWSKLKRDLSRAEVEVFEGPLAVAVVPDDVLAGLLNEQAFGDAPDQVQQVELLASSGFVHAINGAPRSDFLLPDVLEVARARPPRPFPEGTTKGTRVMALTPEERDEVRARATQMWRTPGTIFALVAYFGLGAVMWSRGGAAWWTEHGTRFAILGVFALYGVFQMVRRVRTAVLLGRDAEAGDALEVIEQDERGELHRIVLLPHADIIWSVDDQPGEWRSKRL